MPIALILREGRVRFARTPAALQAAPNKRLRYHVPIALILREANIEDAGEPAYERGVAVFPSLERAARAVATLLEWRRRREGLPELFER